MDDFYNPKMERGTFWYVKLSFAENNWRVGVKENRNDFFRIAFDVSQCGIIYIESCILPARYNDIKGAVYYQFYSTQAVSRVQNKRETGAGF